MRFKSDLKIINKANNHYYISVFISLTSVVFGIFREILIISILGFTAENDRLQVYLSIFYSSALSMDAIKLATLNLCNYLPFHKILAYCGFVALIISSTIGFGICYLTNSKFDILFFAVVIGSALNLIIATIVTYKQKLGAFLGSQIINVLPNFILIPVILFFYFLHTKNLVSGIILACCLIPFFQIIFLAAMKQRTKIIIENSNLSSFNVLMIFIKHIYSIFGQQFFQTITRTMFFKFAPGFLTLISLCTRIYASAKSIFIDSYIGFKLSKWENIQSGKLPNINSSILSFGSIVMLLIFVNTFSSNIKIFAMQYITVLIIGFFFNARLQIIYYRINCFLHDSMLIVRYGTYELVFVVVGYLMVRFMSADLALFILLWYVIKPIMQIYLLNSRANRMSAGVMRT
ncbi:MAG: hypothetical protein KIT27_06415 [Legionellales bacterium]|nr:hypothetical protein [Legionellales bacterium]